MKRVCTCMHAHIHTHGVNILATVAEKTSNFRRKRIFRRLNAFFLVSGSAKTFFSDHEQDFCRKLGKHRKRQKKRRKQNPSQFRGNFSISSSYNLILIFGCVKSKPSVEMFYRTFSTHTTRGFLCLPLFFTAFLSSLFSHTVCNCGNLSCISSSTESVRIKYSSGTEMLRALVLPCIFNLLNEQHNVTYFFYIFLNFNICKKSNYSKFHYIIFNSRESR